MSERHCLHAVLIAAFTCLGALAHPHAAQAQKSPLEAAAHIKCAFSAMASGTWSKDGDTTAEVKKATLTLEYKSIDVSGGSAEAVGIGSNFFITVRSVGGSLHLLTIGDAGPAYLTTVFNRPAHPGTFKAVHTRHEFTDVAIPGFTSRPEQYVGECQILE
jgi:hypothetical protein